MYVVPNSFPNSFPSSYRSLRIETSSSPQSNLSPVGRTDRLVSRPRPNSLNWGFGLSPGGHQVRDNIVTVSIDGASKSKYNHGHKKSVIIKESSEDTAMFLKVVGHTVGGLAGAVKSAESAGKIIGGLGGIISGWLDGWDAFKNILKFKQKVNTKPTQTLKTRFQKVYTVGLKGAIAFSAALGYIGYAVYKFMSGLSGEEVEKIIDKIEPILKIIGPVSGLVLCGIYAIRLARVLYKLHQAKKNQLSQEEINLLKIKRNILAFKTAFWGILGTLSLSGGPASIGIVIAASIGMAVIGFVSGYLEHKHHKKHEVLEHSRTHAVASKGRSDQGTMTEYHPTPSESKSREPIEFSSIPQFENPPSMPSRGVLDVEKEAKEARNLSICRTLEISMGMESPRLSRHASSLGRKSSQERGISKVRSAVAASTRSQPRRVGGVRTGTSPSRLELMASTPFQPRSASKQKKEAETPPLKPRWNASPHLNSFQKR